MEMSLKNLDQQKDSIEDFFTLRDFQALHPESCFHRLAGKGRFGYVMATLHGFEPPIGPPDLN